MGRCRFHRLASHRRHATRQGGMRIRPNAYWRPIKSFSRMSTSHKKAEIPACLPGTIMILFLDFDGVLHPDPCPSAERLFENADRLSATLEPFPEVGIVLSTSWRTMYAENELLQVLPEPLRRRVVGLTPCFSDFSSSAHRTPYHRHAECEQWLRCQEMADSPWVALDDRAYWFAPYCENLIECNSERGYTDETSARLHSALTIARRRMAEDVDLLVV